MKLVNSSTGGSSGNLDDRSSLEEARAILKELRDRNFTLVEKRAQREKENSRNSSIIANKLKEQATAIEERASNFNNKFKDLLQAFKNLKGESDDVYGTSENATALVAMAKEIDWKVSGCFLRCFIQTFKINSLTYT